jgi:integrase
MTKINLRRPSALVPVESSELTFNLVAALPGRASSTHTQRAYFRWIDQYLVDIAGLNSTDGDARVHRMSMLSVKLLQDSLSAQQFRAWLGMLVRAGNGKQGINQARAAIVTLASLLSESELLDDYTSAGMSNVRPPKAEDGQRQGRWLSTGQIKELIVAAQQIATSENQALRNHVITAILCMMALRREELSSARWGDLAMQNDRVVMRVHGKGRKMATIDVPRPVMTLLTRWRKAVEMSKSSPSPESPLIRRIYKGGTISPRPVTADGIWWLVGDAAEMAGLGHVAPHDLRRSVAGALHEAGTPIEKISLLLRHSNVAVTERYLSRLPQRNEGAVLMSDLLGLDYSDEPDWME